MISMSRARWPFTRGVAYEAGCEYVFFAFLSPPNADGSMKIEAVIFLASGTRANGREITEIADDMTLLFLCRC